MKNKFALKIRLFAAVVSLGLISGITPSYGQDTEGAQDTGGGGSGGFDIGAKVGANFNQFSQPGTSVGVGAGGYARYQVLDFLEVQGEVLYSMQGGGRQEFTRDYTQGGTVEGPISQVLHVNRSILLHTVEVPVSARLTMPELNGGAIVPKLIVGGSYSYNFASYETNDKIVTFTDGTQGVVSNTRENVSGDYFPHNYSAHAGIALDFNLANDNVFTMEFRYRQGFQNLNQVKTNIPELNDKIYSSGFSINFSYKLFNL